MIKLENMTPEIYYKQSRDFQFIGRLYDIVLNSAKTDADLIDNLILNNNLDNSLVDLLATTLGFKLKHNYNLKQLTALCSAFSLLLREKGTKSSIQTVIGLILNAEGIVDHIEDIENYVFINNADYSIEIFIPNNLTNFSLLIDLLEYILPAGMTYKIIKGVSKKETAWTEIGLDDLVTVYTPSCSSTATLFKETDIATISSLTDTDTKVVRVEDKPFFYINSSSIKASAITTEGE